MSDELLKELLSQTNKAIDEEIRRISQEIYFIDLRHSK